MVTSQFKFVGGRLCLDFVNTAGARTEVALGDKLRNFDDLFAWTKAAGLQAKSERNNRVFKRAIVFREVLYRVFQSGASGREPKTTDLDLLESELAIARKHQRFRYVKGSFMWTWDPSDAPDRMLWPIALSAAELLASADRKKIRQCGDEQCGWLFLDTSRNHSRQWCDMQDCGNRAKLRRFRARRH